MKGKILLSLIIAAMIFNLGCSSDGGSVDSSPADAVVENDSSQDDQAPTHSIEIKDLTFSDKTEFSTGDSAEIDITVPDILSDTYPDSAYIINEIIEINADSLKNDYFLDVEHNKDAEGTESSARSMTYEVYFADDGLVSLLLKTTVYYPSEGQPRYANKSINFDLKTGTELELSDFADVKVVKSKILSKMRENPDNYLTTDDNCFGEEYILKSFLFNDEKIYIYFDEGMIAPRAAGLQVFEFTYEDVA